MKDNKLIAEFMGMDTNWVVKSTDDTYNYHESWDWLMPVISKIETVGRGWFPHELHTSLIKNNIKNAYKVVVELIKQYNNE